jgi:cardiolipin synthase
MTPARTSPPSAPSESSEGDPAGSRRARLKAAVKRALAPVLTTRQGQRLARIWLRTLALLRPYGVVSQGNQLHFLAEGDGAFEEMWAAIEGARHSVHLTTYILEPDRVGERTLRALEGAAARGCEVLAVLDAFGSHRLPTARLARLRSTGVRVLLYNPIVRWPLSRARLVRNHRKILVVDRTLAFCGGRNVAEEYAGPRHGTALFRDTQLAVEGPAANDLAQLVEEQAAEMLARPVSLAGPQPASGEEGSVVQILESSGRRRRRAIQRALRTKLGRAVERAYLTSPYFVPTPRTLRALEAAAGRGVDVRVLTAGRSDVPVVRRAAQHLYGRLLVAGVRVFELRASVLHAKTAVVDGVSASVGSFNLDHWSERRNLEVVVSAFDPEAARELERHFETDLEGAREVTLERWRKRSWGQRLVGWVAYQVLRL